MVYVRFVLFVLLFFSEYVCFGKNFIIFKSSNWIFILNIVIDKWKYFSVFLKKC